MSNRYWVNGGGTWDNTSTTHWSTESGGSSGASAPTLSDDVFLDSASGAVTVTVGTGSCKNFNCTGFTGTLAGPSNNLKIYGDMILGSGMTCTMSSAFEFSATDTGHTITTNGVSLINIPRFYGLGGGWTLQDDLTTTNDVDIYFGTLNTNGKTVSCNNLYSDGTTNGGLILGSSNIILASILSLDLSNVNFTFDPGTSTIKLNMNSEGSICSMANQGSGTYYNLWINTSGTNGKIVRFSGNYIFNNIKIEPSRHVWIDNGKSVGYSTITANGGDGTEIILRSTSGKGTLNNTTVTPITIDYVNITNITATGQTLTAGRHSINGGGNTNITFLSPTVSPFPSFYQ